MISSRLTESKVVQQRMRVLDYRAIGFTALGSTYFASRLALAGFRSYFRSLHGASPAAQLHRQVKDIAETSGT